MKEYTYNSLGFDIRVSGPETPDEYNQLAKRPGNACLEDAIDSQAYRGVLNKFRDDLAKALETETGIPRLTKTVKLADGTEKQVNDETEKKYVDRVLAQTEKTVDDYAVLASQLGPYVIDPSVTVRTSSGPAVPKGLLAEVTKLFEEQPDKVAGVVKKLSKFLAREVTADINSVAIGLRDAKKKQEADLKASLLG